MYLLYAIYSFCPNQPLKRYATSDRVFYIRNVFFNMAVLRLVRTPCYLQSAEYLNQKMN